MNLVGLPVIDWDQATKLVGNKRELAEEILTLLIKNLPNDISMIKKLHQEQHFFPMLSQVHKLHGALCYCGLPRLKTIVAYLETELKNNIMDSLPSRLNQLDTEVKLLLECYPCQNT